MRNILHLQVPPVERTSGATDIAGRNPVIHFSDRIQRAKDGTANCCPARRGQTLDGAGPATGTSSVGGWTNSAKPANATMPICLPAC